MDAATLRATLQQLQQASHDHAEWRETLIRTLVCRLPACPDDLADDSHRRCRFGLWYHAAGTADLREQAIFEAMEVEHERVHRVAARILRQAADGTPVVREEYDELMAASGRLRVELDALRHEIQDLLRSCDTLTGAFGRARLLPALREWRALARRGVQPCALAFMDLDHLKEINDRHGHTVGDQVLSGAVHYVAGSLRPYDQIFRYGGDEFLITLPGADLESARRLVERIREGFGQVPFVVGADGQPIHATASFGLARLEPDLRVEESVDRADRALLLAKVAGRDRVAVWDPTVTTGTILNWTPDDDLDDD
jgi:diguanylate cyclase (GGDEF)-like protein